MNRCVAVLLLACAGALCFAPSAQAIEPSRRNPQRMQYPPRYTRSTTSQWIVYKNRQGQVVTRKAYVGYKEGFPPPAWLFYGYPKSGDFSGMGIDGGSP